MVIMWFSLHPHFLLYNFAEIMYFIITKKKLRAARADHGPRATDGKGQEKAAALAVSTEDGKFLLGHTPQSWQLLPLQGKEGRKGMTLLSVSSVCRPPPNTHTPHTDLPEFLPCAGHPRGCCQQKVCVCATSLAGV